MDRKEFRKILEEAKGKDFDAFCYTIDADELQDGLKLDIYPLLSSEYQEFWETVQRLREKKAGLEEYAFHLICVKDKQGNRMFDEDDIPMIERLGWQFNKKIAIPAGEMSGIFKDFSVRKKRN